MKLQLDFKNKYEKNQVFDKSNSFIPLSFGNFFDMEQISIFDMLKIGVGPSSSHTLGPWRAAQRWINALKRDNKFDKVRSVEIELFGSLSLTGKGHATDLAVMLGLSGTDPEYIEVDDIEGIIADINAKEVLNFNAEKAIPFTSLEHIKFRKDFLEYHSNGIRFHALLNDDTHSSETYYSIGGGFVVKENEEQETGSHGMRLPFPIQTGDELKAHCKNQNKSISEIVYENELMWRSKDEIDHEINRVWQTMKECMYKGCHTTGTLPGGLNVKRRAFDLNKRLVADAQYSNMDEWFNCLRTLNPPFHKVMNWISCFALSVNEVNASLGRVVTAPTNGSAGVIPAVLSHYLCFINKQAGDEEIRRFLLTAGEVGSIVKKGATISAAMGGCQAEIGVSSAMAAAGLTELLGGSPKHAMMAAEIAMEHHLGLTCDPIGGLVQVPCIERNSMGAIKAINAAELALESDPNVAKISLDVCVETMWKTAKDMNEKYKETSEGGLAVSVNIADC